MKLGSGLTNQSVAGASLSVAVQDVFDEVNAELTWSETGEVLTADGTEQNTYVMSNPLGINVPRVVFIDLDEMVAGDSVTIRVHYRLAQGGGYLLQDWQQYVGQDGGLANSKTLIAVDLYPNRFGLRVTLEQTAGAGFRDFLWKWFGEI